MSIQAYSSGNGGLEPGLAGGGGELFHVEQLGDGMPGTGSDLGGEVERLGDLVTDLGDEISAAAVGTGPGAEMGVEMRARMFAHEVNNLAMSISGRAQRALISGDSDQALVALKMASEVGARVASLCEILMIGGGVGVDQIQSDNPMNEHDACGLLGVRFGEYQCGGGGLKCSEVVAAHEFAVGSVGGHPVMVGGGGVGFVVEVEEGVEVVLPGMLLGQVLVNLYANSLTGIGIGIGDGGVIRLSVRGAGGRTEIVVEDSGCGFGGEINELGHGLGLGVCRAIVGGFGGRIFVGESEEFGGGRVSVVFGRPA